jgi:hypothetical protein
MVMQLHLAWITAIVVERSWSSQAHCLVADLADLLNRDFKDHDREIQTSSG